MLRRALLRGASSACLLLPMNGNCRSFVFSVIEINFCFFRFGNHNPEGAKMYAMCLPKDQVNANGEPNRGTFTDQFGKKAGSSIRYAKEFCYGLIFKLGNKQATAQPRLRFPLRIWEARSRTITSRTTIFEFTTTRATAEQGTTRKPR